MPRPNILFILSDQHRYDCVGVNGHKLVHTPYLDALACDGINFTAAYTPAPVCVPARNSLHFGCWPTHHLAIANEGTEAPRSACEGLTGFSECLDQAGYFLACVGKWQVSSKRGPLDYGYDRYIPESGYKGWRAAQHIAPVPHKNGFYGELDPFASPDQTTLGWGASQVITLLEERVATSADEPFFISWNTSEPHLPNILPEPYFSQVAPAAVEPWASYPDPLDNKPYIQAQQRRSWKLDEWSWNDWAPIVARYLGQVSLIDAQIGRILGALDRLGLAENTMVVYSTDHGDLCGGHGMIDKHYVMYQDVTHVPLIIRWPNQVKAGQVNDAFISHALDLAMTFCDVAKVDAPTTFEGLSLLPLLQGQATNGRSEMISMYFGNQFGLYSQRMLVDRSYKYVWNLTAEDELYRLAEDPGELNNLAADSAYSHKLAEMRARLAAWMETNRDPLLNYWTRIQLLENRKV
ncbi:MAG: sulfatase-like hydrolase/transferase [Anaerolineae bacterium]